MGWIKLGDAVRSQGKAVPGGKGKRQPFQSGDATNEGEIIQALGLQAAPGAHEPLLADWREQLAGGRPVSGLTRLSQRVRSGGPE